MRGALLLGCALSTSVGLNVRPSPRTPPTRITRRGALFALPALAASAPALAGQVGGAGVSGLGGGQETLGGGPPKVGTLAKLTKGEPSDAELKRLAVGYQRLQYLLNNWEKETTVCIKGCKGKYEACGCIRDPIIVQAYMGYKSMEDPLFRAGDLMLRASPRIESDADFDKFTLLLEKWNLKADDGNVMAYVSSWGEANPGGGQDEIARYLEKSRKEVVLAADLLKEVCGLLQVPLA